MKMPARIAVLSLVALFVVAARWIDRIDSATVVLAQADVRMTPQIGRIFIPDSAKKELIPIRWVRCYSGTEMGWCMPPVGADWQEDLQRPEVQKALGEFIQSHCEVAISYQPYVAPANNTEGNQAGTWTVPQKLMCRQDEPSEQ